MGLDNSAIFLDKALDSFANPIAAGRALGMRAPVAHDTQAKLLIDKPAVFVGLANSSRVSDRMRLNCHILLSLMPLNQSVN